MKTLDFGFAGIVAVAASVAWAEPVRADETDAREVIKKAVKAHGGQEKLSALRATTMKFRGQFHGMGEPVEMTGEVATFGPDHVKLDLELSLGGEKIRIVNVLAGEQGWTRFGENVRELTKAQLTEAREQAYANWVATLEPLLKDPAFRFSLIGELKVGEQTTIGVKVSRKDRRDVDLYFDKQTGLLAKIEATLREAASDQDLTEETFLSEYKPVQGVRQAHKFVVKRNGQLFVDGEMTEYRLAEKLDDEVFAKP